MRIGVDLGGTKIEAIALADDGAIRLRRRVATPSGDYDATIRAICQLVAAIEVEIGTTATIGFATPGVTSPSTGLIKNANSTCLIGKPLDVDLAAALQRPVRLANDANCFALSEAIDGAAAGDGVTFGVIIGTGVGGGIVVAGQALTGANAIGGEWGHNPLPWPDMASATTEIPGPDCYCGRSGCIETFLSGPGLAADFETASGRHHSAIEIVALATEGDTEAEHALCRYEHRLARALAHVINIVDPDSIVLGGGLSNIERLYASVPPRWQPYVFSDTVVTKLLHNRHGDSSGVRGAAWLWPAQK